MALERERESRSRESLLCYMSAKDFAVYFVNECLMRFQVLGWRTG